MDENLVYLTQTDTTVGFLSKDEKRLSMIKNRPNNKKYVKVFSSLEELKGFYRVPKRYRREVRLSKRRSYVVNEDSAFRIPKDKRHLRFLKRFKWLYSTSANRSSKEFCLEFAKSVCDVEIMDGVNLSQKNSSSILKLSHNRKVKLR